MFSLTQRFQHVVNHTMTIGIVIAALVIGSSYFDFYQKGILTNSLSEYGNFKPMIGVRASRYFGGSNGKPKENLKISSFDLHSDLTDLFNWNTKQVFVYLTAEYNNTKSNTFNQVTLWDQIILDREHANITLENVRGKYSVWDVSDKLSEKDLKIKLHWNIQPHIGPLIYGETNGEDVIVNFPAPQKKNANEKPKVNE